MSGQIFISYSRRDQEFVFKLANDLEARGGRVWLDQADIRGGTQWRQSIDNGIEQASAFLLLISPDAMDSEYVNFELELAEEQGKPIFPLIYRRTNIPENLSRFQFINFTKGGYQKNLTDLLAGLSSQGIDFQAAPELASEEQANRRRELMGAPIKVRWGTVLKKIPGWAFAWGLGWGIFWVVFAILLAFSDNSSGSVFLLPIGGFVGGLMGGLLAGLITMIALRHNAANISWKHMKSSIRIWGLVGPVGTAIAFGLVILLIDVVEVEPQEVFEYCRSYCRNFCCRTCQWNCNCYFDGNRLFVLFFHCVFDHRCCSRLVSSSAYPPIGTGYFGETSDLGRDWLGDQRTFGGNSINNGSGSIS